MNKLLEEITTRLPLYTYCGNNDENKFTALVSLIAGFQIAAERGGNPNIGHDLIPRDLMLRVIEKVSKRYHVPLTHIGEAYRIIRTNEGAEEAAFRCFVELLSD
jgi:hypothetical protein